MQTLLSLFCMSDYMNVAVIYLHICFVVCCSGAAAAVMPSWVLWELTCLLINCLMHCDSMRQVSVLYVFR